MGIKRNAAYKAPTASRGGGTGNFKVITPGKYLVRVESAEEGRYKAAYKGQQGEFNYLKVRPVFTVLGTPEGDVEIARQDITIGTMNEENELFRPDGNTEKSALFSGAQFFLSAIGFVNTIMTTDENGEEIELLDDAGKPVEEVALDLYDVALLGGQYFLGVVETKSYVSQGATRQKNEIVNFFSLNEAQIEAAGLFRADSGMVFSDADAAAFWQDLFESLPDGTEDDEDGPFGH